MAEYLSRHPSTATAESNTVTNPRPSLYNALHQTYILAITSCAPSHPNLVMTSAVDGHVRVTNMSSPIADHAFCGRTRIGSNCLSWSDTFQSALSAEENNSIRGMALRRFHASVTVARQNANIVCLALSPLHTTALAGAADGSVDLFNPMRKVINPKLPNKQLTWFMHEWSRLRRRRHHRPPKATNTTNSGGNVGGGGGGDSGGPAEGDGYGNGAGHYGRHTEEEVEEDEGMARITEGFKVESPSLFRNVAGVEAADGAVPWTVYEAKSAVTHLAWNANAPCGGWAAAAMGTGLVRVEDLAV